MNVTDSVQRLALLGKNKVIGKSVVIFKLHNIVLGYARTYLFLNITTINKKYSIINNEEYIFIFEFVSVHRLALF